MIERCDPLCPGHRPRGIRGRGHPVGPSRPSRQSYREWVLVLGIVICALGCGRKPAPQPAFENVACRSPTGHRTARTVPRWKFDEMSRRMWAELRSSESTPTAQLFHTIRSGLSQEMVESLDDVDEVMERVLLELEVRGQVDRVPTSNHVPVGTAYLSRKLSAD